MFAMRGRLFSVAMPEKILALTNFLVKRYGEQGVSVNDLIDAQIADAKADNRNLTREEALEEVIADSMETMLADGSIIEMMAELRQQDKTLWEKIRDWFKDLADKLRAVVDAYKGVQPDSDEGRMVADMQDMIGTLQALYMDALVDASENFDGGVQKITTEDSGGVKYSTGLQNQAQITANLTDAQRTEILQTKNIVAPVYAGEADVSIQKETDLESGKISLAKSALVRIGEEFNAFTDYDIEDVDVRITLSRGNLRESVTKDANPVQLAKLIPILKDTVESAIGIESHANRYYYDNTTESFDNLLGGYIDGEYFVPVRFGLKRIKGGEVVLYVVVDQQKIKAEVLKTTTQQNDGSAVSRSAFTYNVPQVISLVNSKDLLRYLPDDMLSVEQKKIKREGIAETIKYTNDKNDAKYAKFIASGNIQAAQSMVDAAAKAAGYTVKAYHGTDADHFSVFDKGKIGASSGVSILGDGFYFSSSKATAKQYGRNVYTVYLKQTNPYAATANDAYKLNAVDLERNGHDSVTLNAGKGSVYMVLDPEQIKSAEPITYDDNGNVIPLSERFNENKSDIRYSQRDVGRQEAVAQALEKENAKLWEDVAELRELVKLQRQVTGGTKFTKTSVEAAARLLKQSAGAKGSTQELSKLLNGLYEHIASGKELSWEGVKEQAQGAVDWLWEHIDRRGKPTEYAQDILKQLHGSRVRLDESQMAEAEYRFGSYEQFHKGLMGSISFAKNADMSLDSLWADFYMSAMH